jgi:Zn-dependent peptidase ImmA (M78 family)
MHALVYKAHATGRLTESNYRYYLMQMSKRGWRTKEPVELTAPREMPRIVRQVIRSHLGPLKYSLGDLATATGLHQDEVVELYDVTETSRLRLVVG